uniref:Uncharacterized protein n=1 Tax=Octactis speculum TaxID=3111310 RepID=A0A7S2C678_9STRA
MITVTRADNRTETAVYGWGCHANGRLGYVNVATHHSPQEILNLTSLMRRRGLEVSTVKAGGSHTLATTTGRGRVVAWGAGTYGQLGSGRNEDETDPVIVNFLKNVVAVVAGYRHSLAIVGLERMYTGAKSKAKRGIKGELWAWGYNNWGEAGMGDTAIRLQPHPVRALEGVLVTDASAGQHHTLICTTGDTKKIGDKKEYAKYFDLLREEGEMVYHSLKSDMQANGFDPSDLDHPEKVVPGQPGFEVKKTFTLHYEPGLRYCLDTIEPGKDNEHLRVMFETVHRVPSVQLATVCAACARRCHATRYVEAQFRQFIPGTSICDCSKSPHCICLASTMRSQFDAIADKHGVRPKRGTDKETVPFDRLRDVLAAVRAPKGGYNIEDLDNARNFLLNELGSDKPFTWVVFQTWYLRYYDTEQEGG